MKRMHILFTIIITVLFAQDFNPGPYGSKAFDFAGPFQLIDLNRPSLGDPNFDEEININDVIILVNYILNTDEILSAEQQEVSDLNDDGGINILDISILINLILGD